MNLLRALAALLRPLAGGAALAWLLGRTTPLPGLLCLLAGCGVAFALAHRRRPMRERLQDTSRGWEAWHRRRGRARAGYDLPAVPQRAEGVFALGVRLGRWDERDRHGELAWAPWDGDPPHLLVAGTTGSGKSRLMDLVGLEGLGWGWRVTVIDAKGGNDYEVLEARGAEVLTEREDHIAALRSAAEEIITRNRRMRELSVAISDGAGVPRRARPRNLRECPPETRGAMPPWLLLIDETATIVAGSDKLAKEGQAALRTLVQLGRSAGVHVVLGMQRPDADLLAGFVKHNLQARIMLGQADQVSEQMVLGSLMATLDEDERLASRPPGRGVAVDVGGPGLARFHAYLLDGRSLLPPADAPLDSLAAGGVALDSSALAGRSPLAVASPLAPPGSLAGSRSRASSLAALAPAASSLEVTPPVGGSGVPRRPSRRSPGSLLARSRSPLARRSGLAARLRLAARSRLARRRLALASWRLLVSRRPAGVIARDPSLRDAVLARDGYTCAACTAEGGPVEVDHRRPLWAGGEDSEANAQVLCVPCHRAKTGAEATVRAVRRRRFRLRRPGLSGYAWAAITTTGLGFLTPLGWSPLPNLFVPALVLGVAVMWFLRPPRGRGIDGLYTLDARLEAQMGGFIGQVAQARNRSVLAVQSLRWATGAVCGLYCLGYLLALRLVG